MKDEMILTTTPTIQGRFICHYLGLVCGEAIFGANLFRDFLASLRDMVGGRARAYEHCLLRAREEALQELQVRAAGLGADAVVGIDIDYEVLGASNGMMMVTASGTAVRLS
jgi:uncharacterized protein YbjQ (UPF0145 family)